MQKRATALGCRRFRTTDRRSLPTRRKPAGRTRVRSGGNSAEHDLFRERVRDRTHRGGSPTAGFHWRIGKVFHIGQASEKRTDTLALDTLALAVNEAHLREPGFATFE